MQTPEYATIYLMRHAETEFNVAEIYQGHTDSALTAEGQEQARKVAEDLAEIHFDAIYTSDLSRTKSTAERIAAERNLEIKATAFLRERFFGSFDGRKIAEIKKEYAHLFAEMQKLSSAKEKYHYTFNDELEPVEKLRSRMFTVLREIALAHLGKNVLVVTHGSSMRSVLSALDPKYYEYRAKNTGYAILACDGVEFEIIGTVGIVPRNKHD